MRDDVLTDEEQLADFVRYGCDAREEDKRDSLAIIDRLAARVRELERKNAELVRDGAIRKFEFEALLHRALKHLDAQLSGGEIKMQPIELVNDLRRQIRAALEGDADPHAATKKRVEFGQRFGEELDRLGVTQRLAEDRDRLKHRVRELERIIAACHEALGESAVSDDQTLPEAIRTRLGEAAERVRELERECPEPECCLGTYYDDEGMPYKCGTCNGTGKVAEEKGAPEREPGHEAGSLASTTRETTLPERPPEDTSSETPTVEGFKVRMVPDDKAVIPGSWRGKRPPEGGLLEFAADVFKDSKPSTREERMAPRDAIRTTQERGDVEQSIRNVKDVLEERGLQWAQMHFGYVANRLRALERRPTQYEFDAMHLHTSNQAAEMLGLECRLREVEHKNKELAALVLEMDKAWSRKRGGGSPNCCSDCRRDTKIESVRREYGEGNDETP